MRKISVVFMMVFLLGACSQSGALEVGGSAPDFALTDTNGESVRLSDFAGKVIILDFFASWCPPCREEIPDFIALEKEYGPKGFAVVGISLVDADQTRAFMRKMGINYSVLVDDGRVSRTYGPVRSIPTTFLIDRDMKVRKVYIGYRTRDVFEADMNELLR